MNTFMLNLFDEKKKSQAEEDMSTEAQGTSENGAPKETGEQQEASAAGKQSEKEASFEELITGEYKEEFAKKVQQIINRRFKASKEAEEKLKLLKEQLATQGEKKDDDYVEALEKRLAALSMQTQRSEAARRAQAAYDGWAKDMEGMQADYPAFALSEELKNPAYAQLLHAGIGLRGAYEALHLDEIKAQIAQKAKEEAAMELKDRASRPEENGAQGASALRLARDVARLSKEERQEIARRAARGEKIKF